MSIFHKKINQNEILKWGILGGAAETLYIFLVALFFDVLEDLHLFLPTGQVVFFTFFLLFFVLSAVISAFLIFGRPAYLMINNQKREALLTLITTLITMLVLFLVIFSVMILS